LGARAQHERSPMKAVHQCASFQIVEGWRTVRPNDAWTAATVRIARFDHPLAVSARMMWLSS
jgi:hypothetical protein